MWKAYKWMLNDHKVTKQEQPGYKKAYNNKKDTLAGDSLKN